MVGRIGYGRLKPAGTADPFPADVPRPLRYFYLIPNAVGGSGHEGERNVFIRRQSVTRIKYGSNGFPPAAGMSVHTKCVWMKLPDSLTPSRLSFSGLMEEMVPGRPSENGVEDISGSPSSSRKPN